jgi:hypothetical protein
VTRAEKITIAALSGALLIVLSVFAYEYVQQVRALATAEGHTKELSAIIAAKDQAFAEAQTRMDTRERDWSAHLVQLAHDRAAVKDVKTASQAVAEVVPGASMVEVKRVDLPPQAVTELPDAPSYALMTKDAAVAFGKAAVDFKQCAQQVTKLNADVADLTQQAEDAKGAEAAAQSKAHQWEQAAKGTVARRMVTAGKWGAVGAAVGVLAYHFAIK